MNRTVPPPKYNVCIFNSADPRGSKVGGIETYTRDYIFYHPEDMNLLLVGADEIGDLPVGEVSRVNFRGREFDFLPLYRLDSDPNNVPSGIADSDTFRFAAALLKNWTKLRGILKRGGYSGELRRVEYAPILWSMGVPFIQMVHVWGAKGQKMSSVLGKYWYVRGITEFLAAAMAKKFFSVNSDMTEMYRAQFPQFAHKFDTLTTWANTSIFKPTPFQWGGDLNVVYAGRLDLFKRPDVMFKVIEALRAKAPNAKFHYIGDGDPNEFPEFAAIADYTTLHGRKTSSEIAELFAQMHVGILTSDFEGMPRVVMELLTAGRPVAALHLPQLEAVIRDGESGYLIPRSQDQVAVLSDRILDIFRQMERGEIQPDTVAQAVEAYRPEALLSKTFNQHRRLHGFA